jgi:hypothetical protein
MRSLSKGRDPYVESLHGFLSLCKQAGVGVVVSYDNGAHQFVIDPCGSGYTPASRDCPIGRGPNETNSDFWTRWNSHRAGCFSMLVHDILESESLSLDQLIKILLYDESCGQLITMRDWLISRERAESLANGIFSIPATEEMSVEPPQVRALIASAGGWRGSSAGAGRSSVGAMKTASNCNAVNMLGAAKGPRL